MLPLDEKYPTQQAVLHLHRFVVTIKTVQTSSACQFPPKIFLQIYSSTVKKLQNAHTFYWQQTEISSSPCSIYAFCYPPINSNTHGPTTVRKGRLALHSTESDTCAQTYRYVSFMFHKTFKTF